jgi:essential nuclear protein 1
LNRDGYYEVPEELEEITKEDEEIIARLQAKKEAPEVPGKKEATLYDLIMKKMNQNQSKAMENYDMKELEQGVASTMNKKVVNVYRGVGEVLKNYRSGKVPKAFKVIPLLSNWEDVMFLTKPHTWSTQAMFEATKIFTSNFNAKMAQRFFNLVLLPAVRSNIDEYKKLNYHLYMAVKKAVFKPNAFFKGFLLPLAQDCSSREAAIIGSILIKVSLPVLHASAALLKMSEYDYSIGTSYFIKVLVGKNYALPSRVIDGVVDYFYSFSEEGLEEYDQAELNPMPVLWHQSMLIFFQKYNRYITDEQKEKLRVVMRVRFNKSITNEIRKELFNLKSTDEVDMYD